MLLNSSIVIIVFSYLPLPGETRGGRNFGHPTSEPKRVCWLRTTLEDRFHRCGLPRDVTTNRTARFVEIEAGESWRQYRLDADALGHARPCTAVDHRGRAP